MQPTALADFGFDVVAGSDRALIDELATHGHLESPANILRMRPPVSGSTRFSVVSARVAPYAGNRLLHIIRQSGSTGRCTTTMPFCGAAPCC